MKLAAMTAVAAAILVVGCAPIAPPQPVTRSSAGGGSVHAPAPSTRPEPPTATRAAPVDSGPSSDARTVLSSIPEPLAATDKVAPPSSVTQSQTPVAGSPAADEHPAPSPPQTAISGGPATGPVGGTPSTGSGSGAPSSSASGTSGSTSVTSPGVSSAPLSSAAPDTAHTSDEGGSDVPVPSPTQPLGERPGAAAIADSMLRPRQAPPTETPAAQASSDSCWRVQIVARKDKLSADRLRNAAHSQLMVNFVVEHEKGVYKVRSRDCMTRPQAEALRQRALQSGFKGAFLSAVGSS